MINEIGPGGMKVAGQIRGAHPGNPYEDKRIAGGNPEFLQQGDLFVTPFRRYLTLSSRTSFRASYQPSTHYSIGKKATGLSLHRSFSMANTVLRVTGDTGRVEAPMNLKEYLLGALPAFGGILVGYDAGYINGVLAMPYFIQLYTGLDPTMTAPSKFALPAWQSSLVVAIFFAGALVGSVVAGDSADMIGRRSTIIAGCSVLCVGVILQIASTGYGLFTAGRSIAGYGVGTVTGNVVMYISEVASKKVRGATVGVFGVFFSVGLLLSSCVDYATQDRADTGCYRIPVAVQLLWALILGFGLFCLPESPRYLVRKGRADKAAKSLSRLRGQPPTSDYIQHELAEIIANYEYELQYIPRTSYLSSWVNCFRGGLWVPSSNLRRTILGTVINGMSQATGNNFVFYFGTTFFIRLGTIKNPFLIGLITSLVFLCSSFLIIWTVDRFGRRPVLIYGVAGMMTCQFLVAIIGTADGQSTSAVRAEIAFICLFIACYASSWAVGEFIVVGEIFPLAIRSRGVGLSTASNWVWNCVSWSPIAFFSRFD